MLDSMMTSLDTKFMHTFLDYSGFMSSSALYSNTQLLWQFANGTSQVQLIAEETLALLRVCGTLSDTILDHSVWVPSSLQLCGQSDLFSSTWTRKCKNGKIMMLSNAFHVALGAVLSAAIDS